MRRHEEGLQPRYGRALGALIAVVVLIAVTRDAWELVIGIAVVTLLVGGHLLQRRARRQTVYDRHSTLTRHITRPSTDDDSTSTQGLRR
ncbi:hypothetical protein GCM10009557_33460 [Virgisporangium ochraceum]